MDLTLDQLQALRAVLGSVAAKASARLGLDLERTDNFLERVRAFVEDARKIVKTTFALSLAANATGKAVLSPAGVVSGIGSGLNLFTVDFDLRLVTAQSVSLDEADTAVRSEESQSLEVTVFEPGHARVLVKGITIGVFAPPEIEGDSHPNGWQRPMSEFDKILQDHVRHAVVREQLFSYWADRKMRVLRSGDEGTERIFQHKLFWWLEKFVSDKLTVFAETSGMGQDKTDVTVVTGAGNYVVEVKWLGRNDKKTTYAHPPRINEGLEQVRIYLANDNKLIRGHLVVYDARTHDAHVNESVHDEQFRHPSCVVPHVVFLDSDTPSVMAEKNVRATKKAALATKPVVKSPVKNVAKGKSGGPKKKATKSLLKVNKRKSK